MMPLSAAEGTVTTTSMRLPRLGELTGRINGVAEQGDRNMHCLVIYCPTFLFSGLEIRAKGEKLAIRRSHMVCHDDTDLNACMCTSSL